MQPINTIKATLVLLCSMLLASRLEAVTWGTAFTYQGMLSESSLPASGLYEFNFLLFETETGGFIPIASTQSTNLVKNGVFTAALDLGNSFNDGNARWLEILVRTNGSANWVTLTPRQRLTPVPAAMYSSIAGSATSVAANAITAVGIANSNITAVKIAGGQVVKSLNGLTDGVTLSAGTNVTLVADGNGLRISATPGTVVTNAGWGLAGNTGTGPANFLGTTDGQPLELRVNNLRALRLENNGANGAPNLIAGGPFNQVGPGVIGATIAGGGASNFMGAHTNRIYENFGTISGGADNTIEKGSYESTISGGYYHAIQAGAYESTIGGGYRNIIQTNAPDSTIAGGVGNIIGVGAYRSSILGGFENTNSAPEATIGGGYRNLIQPGANDGVIAGGAYNLVSGQNGTVGGGQNNVAWSGATVPGGDSNLATGRGSFAAGTKAQALHLGSFVWADARQDTFSSTASYQFLVRAGGGVGINLAAPQADLSVAGSMNIDQANINGSTKTNLLTFGSFSGEGIGSARVGDVNRFGLDFYTAYAKRISITQAGNVGIGTTAPQTALDVNGETRTKVLTITGGADVAEPFEMSDPAIPVGSVVIIDELHPGRLALSEEPYDTRVAGVVSGANGVQPGLTLRQEGALEGTQKVALSGRVYVLADASMGTIRPGDLLSTSPTPGHAMKAVDPSRRQGAILGKAMTRLDEGKGYVLVLVTLQ
jgi:hypothetical protein